MEGKMVRPDSKDRVTIDLDTFTVHMGEQRIRWAAGDGVVVEKRNLIKEGIAAYLAGEPVDPERVYRELMMSGSADNHTMRRYLMSNRLMNGVLFTVDGVEFSCSDVEEMLGNTKKNIRKMTESLLKYCREHSINESELSFFLRGECFGMYLLEYYLRNALSFDPFLADVRFVPGGAEKPIEKTDTGRTDEIFLVLCERDQKKMVRVKASDTQWTEPIFMTAADKIRIECGELSYELAPADYGNPSDSDVIALGIRTEDERTYVRIKSYLLSSKVYELQIDKLEWKLFK